MEQETLPRALSIGRVRYCSGTRPDPGPGALELGRGGYLHSTATPYCVFVFVTCLAARAIGAMVKTRMMSAALVALLLCSQLVSVHASLPLILAGTTLVAGLFSGGDCGGVFGTSPTCKCRNFFLVVRSGTRGMPGSGQTIAECLQTFWAPEPAFAAAAAARRSNGGCLPGSAHRCNGSRLCPPIIAG